MSRARELQRFAPGPMSLGAPDGSACLFGPAESIICELEDKLASKTAEFERLKHKYLRTKERLEAELGAAVAREQQAIERCCSPEAYRLYQEETQALVFELRKRAEAAEARAEELGAMGLEACDRAEKAEARVRELELKIHNALEFARRFGQIDGAHHKAWVIDRLVQSLLCENYEQWVTEYRAGEDGPSTYDWDRGIAP